MIIGIFGDPPPDPGPEPTEFVTTRTNPPVSLPYDHCCCD